jgi:hypothetical protein
MEALCWQLAGWRNVGKPRTVLVRIISGPTEISGKQLQNKSDERYRSATPSVSALLALKIVLAVKLLVAVAAVCMLGL